MTADGKGSHTACPMARTPRAGKATPPMVGLSRSRVVGPKVDVVPCGLGLVNEEHPLGHQGSAVAAWHRAGQLKPAHAQRARHDLSRVEQCCRSPAGEGQPGPSGIEHRQGRRLRSGDGPLQRGVIHGDPQRHSVHPGEGDVRATRVVTRGAVVARAGRVHLWAVDVDRPAASGISVPHGPVRPEGAVWEDPEREHVTGLEGEPEDPPALDVLDVGPGWLARGRGPGGQ